MNLAKQISFIIATGMTFGYAFAAGNLGQTALTYVPQGKILQEKYDEVKIQTAQGGIIEVEFTRSGQFDEASGKNANADVFNAPNNLVPLAKAVQALKAAGKQPSGEWSLDSSFINGWVYEFEGYENGQEMEYYVSASSGKFLKAVLDN